MGREAGKRLSVERVARHACGVGGQLSARRPRDLAGSPVRVTPGATAFTRIPLSPTSAAVARVRCDRAALETSYAGVWGKTRSPAIWRGCQLPKPTNDPPF